MTRTLKGTVVSDKMDKTVVVAVNSVKQHPIYRKQYKVNATKFKAHDEKNAMSAVRGRPGGDSTGNARPLSRDKRWLVARKSLGQGDGGLI